MLEIWEIVKQYAGLLFIALLGSQLNIIRDGAENKKWWVKSTSRLLLSLLFCILADKYVKDYFAPHYWIIIFAIATFAIDIYDWLRKDFINMVKKIVEKKLDKNAEN